VWILLRIALELEGFSLALQMVVGRVLKGRCGKRSKYDDGDLAAGILADDNPVLRDVALNEVRSPMQSRRTFKAALWIAQARTVLRINIANERGASPTAAEVSQWIAEEWPRTERRGRYARFVERIEDGSCRKNFLVKFRRRWQIRLRIMPSRSGVPPEEQSCKVFSAACGHKF
jgi:hypothetical protein